MRVYGLYYCQQATNLMHCLLTGLFSGKILGGEGCTTDFSPGRTSSVWLQRHLKRTVERGSAYEACGEKPRLSSSCCPNGPSGDMCLSADRSGRAIICRSELFHFSIAAAYCGTGCEQVNGAFEGDLIRPLGLVTLYCGYAERELDELLQSLSAVEPFDSRKRRWPIGQKLAYAEKLIHQLERDDLLGGLSEALAEAHRLFERRNVLVHGCLYAGGRLSSNRQSFPEERVTLQDLVSFAESVFNWKETIWLHRQKHLRRALAGYDNPKPEPNP